MMILGKPSTRKSIRHGVIAICCEIFVITQARLAANEVASGAAEMNNPVLKASSSLL